MCVEVGQETGQSSQIREAREGPMVAADKSAHLIHFRPCGHVQPYVFSHSPLSPLSSSLMTAAMPTVWPPAKSRPLLEDDAQLDSVGAPLFRER